MIVDVIDDLGNKGSLETTVQPDFGSTYAKMLKKDEGKIDWSKPAAFIDRQIRALNPWPGTWCEGEKNRRLKVLEIVPMPFKSDEAPGTIIDEDGVVVCGDGGTVKLEAIQPESKNAMNITNAYSGGYLKSGLRLS